MILLSYGTRPEYIKIKPLIDEFNKNGLKYKVLFTGQHVDLIKDHKYDFQIYITSDGINRTINIVKSILNVFSNINENVDYVLVQGDTTSALAVALSAFYSNIKIIHLEAGLRTYDKNNPYPEEINRRIISQISDIHLCPTEESKQNLINEKVNGEIHVVGNTIIDNLLSYKEKCKYTDRILITMHRCENHHWMNKWFIELDLLAKKYPEFTFILPIHPNPNVQKHKHLLENVIVIDPLPYEKMLDLVTSTRLVITDSGGLQEECSFFNKKCLVCRKVTERPEVVGQSSFMVKSPEELNEVFTKHIDDYEINYDCPFGDGHSAQKIIEILKNVI